MTADRPLSPWVAERRGHVSFGLQLFPIDTKGDAARITGVGISDRPVRTIQIGTGRCDSSWYANLDHARSVATTRRRNAVCLGRDGD